MPTELLKLNLWTAVTKGAERFERLLALSMVFSATYAASADTSIPVANSSFESPNVPSYDYGGAGSSAIAGWTISGSGVAGLWNPSTYSGAGFSASDGLQIGFINGSGGTAVSQTLPTTLQPNSVYNLSIDIAGRADGDSPGANYSVSLYAGADLLTSVTPVVPTPSAWTTLTATYSSGAVVSSDPLRIVVSTPATQLDFDNVKLTDHALIRLDRPITVPDAGSVSWIAALGLMAFTRFVRTRK